MIKSKNPSKEWLEKFINPSIFSGSAYKIHAPEVAFKLDQNEAPLDWPNEFKKNILEKLEKMPWNRYPSANSPKVNACLAKLAGVEPEQIISAPGSDYLLVNLLKAFSLNKETRIILTEPSFPVVAMQAKVQNIPYQIWPLDEQFNFSTDLLPPIKGPSVVFFASPNNPTGCVLSKDKLKNLLTTYPDTFWIADEAYLEFHDEDYLSLTKDFSNLILIRTLSKSWAAAGLRIGYMIASPDTTAQFSKLRLAYMLNHFSTAAIYAVDENPKIKKYFLDQVQIIKNEKDRVFKNACEIFKIKNIEVFSSYANFFMIRLQNTDQCENFYQHLLANNILVRNISQAPRLSCCLRISIGTKEQNDILLAALKSYK